MPDAGAVSPFPAGAAPLQLVRILHFSTMYRVPRNLQ